MGSYWVEHWAVFSPGTEYYSFEGAIFSPWYSINIGSSHHDTPLQFFFDQNECPHVGDQFELIVDVGSTYLDAGGSIDPYWEEVTGSLTL